MQTLHKKWQSVWYTPGVLGHHWNTDGVEKPFNHLSLNYEHFPFVHENPVAYYALLLAGVWIQIFIFSDMLLIQYRIIVGMCHH